MSLISVHEVYLIQDYVMKFFSDLLFSGFLLQLPWYNWNLVEVVFNNHNIKNFLTLTSYTFHSNHWEQMSFDAHLIQYHYWLWWGHIEYQFSQTNKNDFDEVFHLINWFQRRCKHDDDADTNGWCFLFIKVCLTVDPAYGQFQQMYWVAYRNLISCNKNVVIKVSVHNAFLEYITFIRYTQDQKIGKPNNLKVFGANKPTGLNRMAKISYGNMVTYTWGRTTLVLIIIT